MDHRCRGGGPRGRRVDQVEQFLDVEVQLLGEFAVGEVERLAAGLPLLGQVTEADLKLMA